MAGSRRIEAHAAKRRLVDIRIREGSGQGDLAVLDKLHATLSLSCEQGDLGGIIEFGGGFDGGGGGGSGGDEASDGVARPAHQGEQGRSEDDLNRSGKAEPAQLRAIVHVKVAVPEKAGRCRQKLVHSPRSKNPCGPRTSAVRKSHR